MVACGEAEARGGEVGESAEENGVGQRKYRIWLKVEYVRMRRAKEDIADRGLEGVGVDVVVVVVEVEDVEIAAWRVRGSRRDTRPHVNAKHRTAKKVSTIQPPQIALQHCTVIGLFQTRPIGIGRKIRRWEAGGNPWARTGQDPDNGTTEVSLQHWLVD